MKIKNRELEYETVLSLPREKHLPPKRPSIIFRTLLKTLSIPELKATNFSLEKTGMERLGKNEPALFLMNHSSFIDLKIAAWFSIRALLTLSAHQTALSGKMP